MQEASLLLIDSIGDFLEAATHQVLYSKQVRDMHVQSHQSFYPL